MVKPVYVPEAGGIIDFPDEATPKDIVAYVDKVYGGVAAANQAPESPDESSILGRAAYGFATGFTDIPGGIAALGLPAEQVAKTGAGQFSEGARSYLQSVFGIDPTKDPTTAQQAAQVIGNLGSFLVPGAGAAKLASVAGKGAKAITAASAAADAAAAARAAKIAGTTTAAAQGVALGAAEREQKIQQQLAAGMEISPEQQLAAQQLDGLIGIAEAAPIGRFFAPVTQLLSKVPVAKAPIVEKILQNRLSKISRAGAAEGIQEAASGIANDLVEYGVYNPDTQIGDDLLSNAGYGAFAGSFVEGVIQIAAGRRLRPYRQLQKDLESEKQGKVAEARQRIVSDAAEELRNANVEGPVEVVEDDIDGTTTFRIKTENAGLIGEIADRDTALEAIELYRQRTGANIKALQPEKSPEAFPVKVGGKSFGSLEDVKIAQDSLRGDLTKISDLISDTSMLERSAKIKGVSPAFYKTKLEKDAAKLSEKLKAFDEFVQFASPAQPITIKPGPAIWANKDYDIPITVVDEPPQIDPKSGQEFRKVSLEDGTENYVPAAEIKLPPEPVEAAPEPAEAVGEAPPIGITEAAPEATVEGAEAIVAPEAVTPPLGEPLESQTGPTPVQTEEAVTAEPIEAQPRISIMAAAKTPRAYTPEESARRVAIGEQLTASIGQIVPEKFRVEVVESTKSQSTKRAVDARAISTKTPEGIDSIIEVSINHMKPGMTVEEAVKSLVDVVNHEVIHVLRDKGLFRPREWEILSRAAMNTNVPGKPYTYMDKAQAVYTPDLDPLYADPEAVLEEAIADMYRDWVSDKKAPVQTRGLFNRMTEFFRKLFRAVRNTHHENVFKAIKSGEMGERTEFFARPPSAVLPEAGTESELRPRFSAAPLPDYLEEKNKTLIAQEPKRSILESLKDTFTGGNFFNLGEQAKVYESPTFKRREISRGERWRLANRQALVDNNAVIRFIEEIVNEQETGNRQRQEYEMSAYVSLEQQRNAGRINLGMLDLGRYDVRFARPGDYQSIQVVPVEDADRMVDVFTVLNEPGPIDPATGEQRTKGVVFQDYAIAKRGARLKAEGRPIPKEIDQKFIDTAISFAEKEYPEVVEAYEKYQRINKNLIKTALDTGFITQKEFSDYTKQMDYYGFYREIYEEPVTQTTPGKVAGKISVRAYKGSEKGSLMGSPIAVIHANTTFWTNAILKNIATRKTFDLLNRVGEVRLLQTGEKPDREKGESDEVMFFKQDGVLKRFAVKDKMIAEALGANNNTDVGAALQMMGMPAKWLRESVTRDPIFSIFNLLRDTLSSWQNSGEDFKPVIDSFKGMASALKRDASYKTLMAYGSVGSYDIGVDDVKTAGRRLERMYAPKNIHVVKGPDAGLKLLRLLWEKAGVLSDASDAATRIAIYNAARKAGASEGEAATRAREIMDFGRHGTSQVLSALVKLIPFLNARIQGLDVLYGAGAAAARTLAGRSRGERDANIGKKFLIRGAMLAAITLAFEKWNEEDEEYAGVEDYIKNSNVLISLKKFGLPGQFLAYPKPFENGLIFSTLPQQIYKTYNGDASTRDNINLFVGSFSSTFGISPLPQFLIPAVEVMTGWDFYTGQPLVPSGTARLLPELQYTKRTSQFAMMLGNLPIYYDMDTGKFGGASPINIDNLISGYGGPLGTYLVQGISLLMEEGGLGPERLPRSFVELPGVRRVLVDAEYKNPKVVSQAYELFGVVDEINRSFGRLKQIGDAEALAEFVEENREALASRKTVFKIVEALNKMTAQERRIAQDATLSREEKFEAMSQLREARIRIASNLSEINARLGR